MEVYIYVIFNVWTEWRDRITIKICLLIFLLISAMIFDLISYKVPNQFILAGVGISLGFGIYEQGLSGIIQWGIGIIVPFGILFLCYFIHVIGAGDIKLFSVIGSFLGVNQLVRIMILAFIIGAVMSLIQLIRFRNLNYRLQYLANYIQFFKQNKTVIPYYNSSLDGYEVVIPFTAAITLSTIYIMVKAVL